MDKIVLAVVGLPGAGKTVTTDYLLKKTGWPKVYFGQITYDEMARRGLTYSEANDKVIREELRAKHGMGGYATLSMPRIKELYKTSSVVLESMYSWEEYLMVRQEFGDRFKTLAIYASPQTRIARMGVRSERPLTPAEVISRDFAQIENLHQAGPIARADFTIVNEDALAALYKTTDTVLEKLGVVSS